MEKPASSSIGKSFSEVVIEVLEFRDFMREYDRLNGTRFSEIDARSPLEKLVDDSCGVPDVVSHEEILAFLRFVRDYVWAPVLRDELNRVTGAV